MLGAGAMGSVIGGHLALTDNDVVLINIDPEFVEAVNKSGLILETGNAEHIVKVLAVTETQHLEPFDLVIVLVKSFHTQAAIESAINLVGENTMVMSLQNGLGQESLLSEVVGREHVIAGKTYVGGMMLTPGKVKAGVAGKETIIGEIDGQLTPRIKEVERIFNDAGLKTVATDNIMGAMWDKLLINVAAGALSAITGLNFGNLYDIPSIKQTGVEAVAEAMRVASALGVTLSLADPEEAWVKASAGLPFDFKPSVLQSIENGMTTEIDFINGFVVSQGKAVGIPTPVNATLVACLKGVERGLNPKKA
ncbi:ketopantoate reductase family protein [Grimontia kaedaensis]|uniref:2-dehydropantoate 2-reductase n=2 Tax=Grimontia kaedaensis TaxID=2872157 RepID=A0ABY4X315_9GAMM|nr:ketopantoate reductase family protein [Grimontia kaedaensis]